MADKITLEAGEEYQVEQRGHFTRHTGKITLPRCRSGAAPAVVRVHGEYGKRQVDWSVQRQNRPPLVPSQDDIPDADVFLGGTFTAALPVPDPTTGTYSFRISGSYEYVQTPVRIPGVDPIPTGSYPFPQAAQDVVAAGQIANLPAPVSPITDRSGWHSTAVALSAAYAQNSSIISWPFAAIPADYGTDAYFRG